MKWIFSTQNAFAQDPMRFLSMHSAALRHTEAHLHLKDVDERGVLAIVADRLESIQTRGSWLHGYLRLSRYWCDGGERSCHRCRPEDRSEEADEDDDTPPRGKGKVGGVVCQRVGGR